MALLVTFLAGISMALGALVVKVDRHPDLIGNLSVALALGSMGALVALDLGPEAVEAAKEFGATPAILAVAAGAALLLALDHFIPDHDDEHTHELHRSADDIAVHIGLMTVLALVIHNIVEGMTIYALSAADLRQGAIYALGVGLHNIPMGMLVYSTLRHEKSSVKLVAFGGALLSTVLGGLVMIVLSPVVTDQVMGMLTCVALGMILYIAIAELLPHSLKVRPAWVPVSGTIVGVAVVWLATMLG